MPWHGYDVAALGRHWRMSPDKLDDLDQQGRIYWPKKGFPRLVRYLDEVVVQLSVTFGTTLPR